MLLYEHMDRFYVCRMTIMVYAFTIIFHKNAIDNNIPKIWFALFHILNTYGRDNKSCWLLCMWVMSEYITSLVGNVHMRIFLMGISFDNVVCRMVHISSRVQRKGLYITLQYDKMLSVSARVYLLLQALKILLLQQNSRQRVHFLWLFCVIHLILLLGPNWN